MIRTLLAILSLLLVFTSCSTEEAKPESYGLYYWRTTFDMTEAEQKWMDSVGVKTLYVRLFDVVDDANDCELGLRPESTIRNIGAAKDVKRVEIVPVVFIAPGVITQKDADKASLIADKILTRMDDVMQMNGLPLSKEVQIDYDWAQSNMKVYFEVLRTMAERLHKEGRTLSTTIRLHQLGMEAPPADRGVLMCYNTGRLQDVDEENSILSRKSVEPYLRHLSSYSLPLSLALPQFSWNVVFRNGEFAFLAPGLPLNDTTAFARIDSTHWRSRTYQSVTITASTTTQAGQRVMPGDMIRREESNDELNNDMIRKLGEMKPDVVREIIYYKN